MNTLAEFRQPPASIEAEQSLLGALLLSNEVYERVSDLVCEADFYRQEHRLIFRHVSRLIESSRPVDLVTLAEALGADLVHAGGVSYLGSLSQNTPSAANVRRYAEIVREKSVERQLATVCTDTLEQILQPGSHNVPEILDAVESKIFELNEQRVTEGRTIGSLLGQVVEEIDARYHSDDPNKLPGLSTGFVDLDKLIGGLEAGDLVVVAGRPSMGKTSIAMNMVEQVSIEDGQASAVFSLEMSNKQLAQRMLGSVARIDQTTLKRGTLTDEQWQQMSVGMGKLASAPILIEETTALSIGGLRARARRAFREYGKLGVIVIDYIGLMAAPGETRAQGIGDVTRGLKALAKELNVPIIALAQLNRKLEERINKRPTMADLRDSGSIEQDADKIIFVYRDEEYHEDSLDKGVAEAIVGKNRNGPTGTVYLTWLSSYTRFENIAPGYERQRAPKKSRERGFRKPAPDLNPRADIDG